MAEHIAILKKPYLDLIIAGKKTIESRLTKTALPPYRRVGAGDLIYFKQSSGPFRATAVVERVRFYDDLSPGVVDEIRMAFGEVICGDDEYWQMKRNSRYGTLLWLKNVREMDREIAFGKLQGRAWFLLSDGK